MDVAEFWRIKNKISYMVIQFNIDSDPAVHSGGILCVAFVLGNLGAGERVVWKGWKFPVKLKEWTSVHFVQLSIISLFNST